jgi:hypothetical protein
MDLFPFSGKTIWAPTLLGHSIVLLQPNYFSGLALAGPNLLLNLVIMSGFIFCYKNDDKILFYLFTL